MGKISTVSNYLIEHSRDIAHEVVDYNVAQLDFEVPKEIVEIAVKYQTEFVTYLAEAITYTDEEQAKKGFFKWNQTYGQQEVSLIDKVSSISRPYPDIRLLFNRIYTTISKNHRLSLEEAAIVHSRLNYFLDICLTESIFAYEQYREGLNEKLKEEMIELSMPVVPIESGMAVLPLIGALDDEKAEHLLNKVVPTISAAGIQHLIIDFSGVTEINPKAASRVFSIHGVLQLSGIKAMFTGLDLDLEQEAAGSGMNFSAIEIYSNIKEAIESKK